MVDSTHHPHALGEIHTTWCLTNYALIKRHTSGSLQLAYTQNHRTARKIDNLRKKKKQKLTTFLLPTASIRKIIFYILIKLFTLSKRQVGSSEDQCFSVNNN